MSFQANHFSLPEGSLYINVYNRMSNRIRYNNFAPRSCQLVAGRKIAETVVNSHQKFWPEKWTLNLAVGGIYNALPLTKDRRPPQRHVLTIAGTSWLRLLYHHVADHVIVPLGEALVLRIPLGQHPLGIRLSLEKLRPNV